MTKALENTGLHHGQSLRSYNLTAVPAVCENIVASFLNTLLLGYPVNQRQLKTMQERLEL
ncbi:Protein of unknown function [Pyronema omphalodes CBS 100304]|uniref:Uncharacterized protein n=1 Tax=Pyronema omphalodes (strain CBS 100304) TaxID=1076935 RepID=U4LJT3_PYROM|nr:Protein of unknown function [Pyronema omphalodes CBS 100304]